VDTENLLTHDEVGNQARFLLTEFIVTRMKADGFDHKAVVNKLVEPDSPLSPPGINTLLYYIICSVGLIYGLYDPYVKYMCNMIYSTTYLLYHPSYRKHSEGHTP